MRGSVGSQPSYGGTAENEYLPSDLKHAPSEGYLTDAKSDIVSMSMKSFALKKRKRFVFKFPGGNYTHAVKFGDTDSWLDIGMGSDYENKQNQQNDVSAFQRIQIQGEVQSLVQNHDIITDPEMVQHIVSNLMIQAIQEYIDHRKYLTVFLALICVYEVIIQVYFYDHKEEIVKEISQICRDLTLEKIKSLLEIRNVIDLFINVLMYIVGFAALKTSRVTLWNTFSWLLMASIFSRLVISYFHLYSLLLISFSFCIQAQLYNVHDEDPTIFLFEAGALDTLQRSLDKHSSYKS